MSNAASTELSIIVVSYNTRDLTLDCLRSVYRETANVDFELILIDNASEDGSAAAIRDEFPDVRLFPLKENLGFAGANNMAAQYAHGEYMLLLNPDTVVLDHAIDRIMDFARNNSFAGIWGGRTVFADGSLNATSCWGKITPWSLFCRSTGISSLFSRTEFLNPEEYGGWLRDSERAVDIVTGCFLLIRKEDWERLGGFDLEFYMYGEEADLCLRARTIGHRPMITPTATIIHYGGASDTVRPRRIHNVLAARAKLIRKHVSPVLRPVALLMFIIWPFMKFLKASISRSPEREAWRTVCKSLPDWYNEKFKP